MQGAGVAAGVVAEGVVMLGRWTKSFVWVALALSVVACSDEETTTPETEQISLGLATADTVTVELLADASLHVGLNRVYFRVKKVSDGALVTSATIDQTPMMTMSAMSMEHSAPHEQPAAVAVDGLFPAYVVFQMASSEGNTWRIDTVVDVGAGAEDVSFDVSVANSTSRKDLPMGEMGTAIVTLDFDEALKVGQNTFTLTVNQKADMHGMTWEPLTDLAVTVVPDMPSMGHGSSNNVNPVHVEAGRYEGSINLTMPGSWRVMLTFEHGGMSMGSLEYQIEL